MKKVIIIVAILGIALSIKSQETSSVISFEKTVHDFGDVKEDGGVVTYSFSFTNKGKQPLVIHNVSASCGCTTPDYTRTPVPAGGKGFVSVSFDPRNRPGNINKTLTVTSNSQQGTDILRITGKVLAKEKTMEDIYPRPMGNIRLKSTNLAFTKVEPNTSKSETLEFINTSALPVTITFDKVPAHLTMKVAPETVQPGATGNIIAVFDASKKKEWGLVSDNVWLVINGDKTNDNRISVSATIEEDYSKWTAEQLAKAPVIEFNETVHDFGQIKKGDKVTNIFVVKNSGKSNLNLRKVSSSCGCTVTQPAKNDIAPGESTTITVTFDSRGRSGRQNQAITVLSNDPKKSQQRLTITANIVD
ncbi:MAG: DUF1573 domain-containing protein [Marinilabiliaceae bacterium]|nr:DUF1573 domain-containing protein [Marinilabiliaceae bacterium]